MHRICMGVVQPGEVAALEGELGFSIGMPHLASACVVEAINGSGGIRVQVLDETPERFCGILAFGTVGDEVVVVCEDRPRFERPAVFFGEGKDALLEESAAVGSGEMMYLVQRPSGEKIDACFCEPMGWRVRPIARAATGAFIIRQIR